MIITALIIYLGTLVDAPNWFYVLAGGVAFIQIIQWGWKMYKNGKKKGDGDV